MCWDGRCGQITPHSIYDEEPTPLWAQELLERIYLYEGATLALVVLSKLAGWLP